MIIGAACYQIISGNFTEDGGSYHKLYNNLFAHLITNDYITPEQFGCYGDEGHDDTQAFKNAIAYSSATGVIIRSYRNKTYIINEKIILNQSRVGLDLGNATLKTTNANLDYLLHINDNVGRRKISNVTLDCNNLCGGIYSQWAGSFTLEQIYIINVKTYGIYIYKGNFHIRNIFITGSSGNATGLFIEDGTDSKVEHVTIKNCKYGIDNRDGINYFDTCHVWLGSNFNADDSVAFNIHGITSLTNCYADTYQIAYRIVNHNTCYMTNCRCIVPYDNYNATKDPIFLSFVNSESDLTPRAANADKTYLYSFHCSMSNGASAAGFTPKFSDCQTNDVMQYLPLKKISKNGCPSEWELKDYWLTSFHTLNENFTFDTNEIKVYDSFVNLDVQAKANSSLTVEPNTSINLVTDSTMPFTTSNETFIVPITTNTTTAETKGFVTVLIKSVSTNRYIKIAFLENVIKGYGMRIQRTFPIN